MRSSPNSSSSRRKAPSSSSSSSSSSSTPFSSQQQQQQQQQVHAPTPGIAAPGALDGPATGTSTLSGRIITPELSWQAALSSVTTHATRAVRHIPESLPRSRSTTPPTTPKVSSSDLFDPSTGVPLVSAPQTDARSSSSIHASHSSTPSQISSVINTTITNATNATSTNTAHSFAAGFTQSAKDAAVAPPESKSTEKSRKKKKAKQLQKGNVLIPVLQSVSGSIGNNNNNNSNSYNSNYSTFESKEDGVTRGKLMATSLPKIPQCPSTSPSPTSLSYSPTPVPSSSSALFLSSSGQLAYDNSVTSSKELSEGMPYERPLIHSRSRTNSKSPEIPTQSHTDRTPHHKGSCNVEQPQIEFGYNIRGTMADGDENSMNALTNVMEKSSGSQISKWDAQDFQQNNMKRDPLSKEQVDNEHRRAREAIFNSLVRPNVSQSFLGNHKARKPQAMQQNQPHNYSHQNQYQHHQHPNHNNHNNPPPHLQQIQQHMLISQSHQQSSVGPSTYNHLDAKYLDKDCSEIQRLNQQIHKPPQQPQQQYFNEITKSQFTDNHTEQMRPERVSSEERIHSPSPSADGKRSQSLTRRPLNVRATCEEHYRPRISSSQSSHYTKPAFKPAAAAAAAAAVAAAAAAAAQESTGQSFPSIPVISLTRPTGATLDRIKQAALEAAAVAGRKKNELLNPGELVGSEIHQLNQQLPQQKHINLSSVAQDSRESIKSAPKFVQKDPSSHDLLQCTPSGVSTSQSSIANSEEAPEPESSRVYSTRTISTQTPSLETLPSPDLVPHEMQPELENTLNSELWTLYKMLIPSETFIKRMQILLKKLQNMVDHEWPRGRRFTVVPFGSAVTQLFTRFSDLDVCFTSTSKNNPPPAQVMNEITHMLRKNGITEIDLRKANARVPVVRFVDPETKVSCDINFNNVLALHNTVFVRKYADIHPLARPLMIVIKFWTQRRILNNAAAGSLSSYCWIIMIIYFLQQKSVVPVLRLADISPEVAAWEAKSSREPVPPMPSRFALEIIAPDYDRTFSDTQGLNGEVLIRRRDRTQSDPIPYCSLSDQDTVNPRGKNLAKLFYEFFRFFLFEFNSEEFFAGVRGAEAIDWESVSIMVPSFSMQSCNSFIAAATTCNLAFSSATSTSSSDENLSKSISNSSPLLLSKTLKFWARTQLPSLAYRPFCVEDPLNPSRNLANNASEATLGDLHLEMWRVLFNLLLEPHQYAVYPPASCAQSRMIAVQQSYYRDVAQTAAHVSISPLNSEKTQSQNTLNRQNLRNILSQDLIEGQEIAINDESIKYPLPQAFHYATPTQMHAFSSSKYVSPHSPFPKSSPDRRERRNSELEAGERLSEPHSGNSIPQSHEALEAESRLINEAHRDILYSLSIERLMFEPESSISGKAALIKNFGSFPYGFDEASNTATTASSSSIAMYPSTTVTRLPPPFFSNCHQDSENYEQQTPEHNAETCSDFPDNSLDKTQMSRIENCENTPEFKCLAQEEQQIPRARKPSTRSETETSLLHRIYHPFIVPTPSSFSVTSRKFESETNQSVPLFLKEESTQLNAKFQALQLQKFNDRDVDRNSRNPANLNANHISRNHGYASRQTLHRRHSSGHENINSFRNSLQFFRAPNNSTTSFSANIPAAAAASTRSSRTGATRVPTTGTDSDRCAPAHFRGGESSAEYHTYSISLSEEPVGTYFKQHSCSPKRSSHPSHEAHTQSICWHHNANSEAKRGNTTDIPIAKSKPDNKYANYNTRDTNKCSDECLNSERNCRWSRVLADQNTWFNRSPETATSQHVEHVVECPKHAGMINKWCDSGPPSSVSNKRIDYCPISAATAAAANSIEYQQENLDAKHDAASTNDKTEFDRNLDFSENNLEDASNSSINSDSCRAVLRRPQENSTQRDSSRRRQENTTKVPARSEEASKTHINNVFTSVSSYHSNISCADNNLAALSLR